MTHLSLEDFEREALATLMDFARIPSLSPLFDEKWADTGHIEAAVDLITTWAATRGLADVTIEVHRLEGRTPVVLITVPSTAPADVTGTVILYGHLDKQPPLGEWSEGLDPFEPVRRGDQIFARGIADDGYSAFSALLALEALEANHIAHGRCVVLIEASEESGSTDLEAHLAALSDHLGDVELLICLDSGAITYDRLWVTTSLRGVLNAEITVSVLTQAQHSGSASGVAPSSFRILRQLLDRIEDPVTGEILLPEFHAPIPSSAVAAAESVAAEFGDVAASGLPTVEGLNLMGSSAADRILGRTWRPTLSVIGMGGIPQPEIAGNVLRPSTTCVISCRLPPTLNYERALSALVTALTSNIPHNAHVTVSAHGANGWAAPETAPWLSAALEEASLDAFGNRVGFTGEGGSIPFLGSLAVQYPKVQFVATGVLGPHSNAHGIDEMLDLPTVVSITNAVATILQAHANHQERS